MIINRVDMGVTDLSEAADFWSGTMGLNTRGTDAEVEVALGPSTLRLTECDYATSDHLAFAIAADSFAGAKAWLWQRVGLISRGGVDEFDGPPGWDSRSLYFPGPSSSVLEFIARNRLPTPLAGGDFGAADILGISEVGITVPDVPAAVRQLAVTTGLQPFAGTSEEDFAALGDDHGLLILAATGRTWFPTGDQVARLTPVALEGVDPTGSPLRITRDLLDEPSKAR